MTGVRQAEPWLDTILLGDARDRLAGLPDSSIDTVITSPPYYGLRDYGVPGQLGLEHDVAGWVAELRSVMADVARVLKPSGVLWLNLGDGYSRHVREGVPVKSLLLGPERLALSLVADGWILRNKVIWAKTNPMPTSVTDRLSTTYEVVYCFVRSRRYFFDLDAIRVPHRSALLDAAVPGSHFKAHKHPWAAGRVYPPASAVATIREIRRTQRNTGLGKLKVNGITGHPLGKNPGDVWHLATAGYKEAHFATFPVALVERPLLASCPERVCCACGMPWRRKPLSRGTGQAGHGFGSNHSLDGESRQPPRSSGVSSSGRPPRLAMPDERSALGKPIEFNAVDDQPKTSRAGELGNPGGWDESRAPGGLHPACTCQAAYRPGVVLDPFMGAGTVAVAAERHGREWVGIELNPAYAALAEARIAKEQTKRRESQERTRQRQATQPGVAREPEPTSRQQPEYRIEAGGSEAWVDAGREPHNITAHLVGVGAAGAEAIRPYDARAA